MDAARDVGLGTAYERWAIYRRLVAWFGRRPPATALEGPVDGMAGMAGLHLLCLARRGTRVTVVLPSDAARARVREVYARAGLADRLTLLPALPDASAELALLFNPAAVVDDWRGVLREVALRAERHLLVLATHPSSYGAILRRGLRRLEPGPRRRELFEREGCDPRALRPALAAHGDLVAEAFVDCPWWPDLFVEAGETLAGASLARLRGRSPAAGPTVWDAGPEALGFAESDEPPAIRRALARHPHFDGRPAVLSGWFAHHRAYLVQRHRMDLLGGREYP